MRTFSIIFALLFFLSTAHGQSSPFIWGSGTAKNLTDSITYKNNVTLNSGSVDPTVTATPGNPGSIYISTSGTAYIKQDSGSSTNWLPFSASAGGGGITAINAQSGPTVTIQAGTSGTDFAVSSSANTITLNLPTASASNRGALSTTDWSTFNNKQAAITGAATTVTSSNLTANRAVISNGSGKLAVSATSDTELGYVSGVTSAIQAQIDGKEPSITVLPIAKGGTNSSAALNNNRVMQSLGDAVVEAAAITPNRALVSDANGIPTHSTVTNTELGYVSGVTSAIQTQLNGKEASFSLLPLSKGGSNKNMTPAAGGIVYTDSDSQEVSAAGTSGQVLISGGSGSPTWGTKSISGKAQAVSSVTVEEIQAPNSLFTQTSSGKYLNETGNNNILANPSFEHSTPSTSWTLSAGSSAAEATVKIHGEQSLKLTLTAETLAFYQDSTRYQAQFADGVQGVASVRVKTSVSGIFVCPRQAGATVLSNCATVNSDSKWMLYKVPYVFGGTSNGIAIVSGSMSSGTVTTGAVTGDVYVDDAYVGTDAGIADVDSSVLAGFAYIAGTTNCGSWTRTSTSMGAFASDADCPGPTIEYSSLGSWQTTDSNLPRFTVNALPSGRYKATFEFISAMSTSASTAFSIYDGTSTCTATPGGTGTPADNTTVTCFFNYTSSGDRSFELFGASSTGTLTVVADINTVSRPMKFFLEYYGSTQVFASQCGAACENTHTAYMDISTGVISGENVEFISGNAGGTSSSRSISFDSGTYSATPVCGLSLVYGSSSGVGIIDPNAPSVSTSGITGIVAKNASTAVVLTTGTIKITCDKATADYQSSRTIIGSFRDTLTAKNSVRPFLGSADISAAGAISNNDEGYFSSASCSSGAWTVNFTGTSKIRGCMAFFTQTSSLFTPRTFTRASSTQVTFSTVNSSSTLTCADINLTCWGTLQ